MDTIKMAVRKRLLLMASKLRSMVSKMVGLMQQKDVVYLGSYRERKDL